MSILSTYIIVKAQIEQAIKDLTIEGVNGKSAYDIAVENGFEGTEQEWLNSLQGTTPHIGENGNWFLGDIDTGVLAAPNLEDYYHIENLIAMSPQEVEAICK